jgi:sugar-specific transcriptional regulator TrmB
MQEVVGGNEALTTQGTDIQVLMDLGLTLLQAKTYLALSALGSATVKAVSKASAIARSDTYRIMHTLQEKGLAARMMVAPAMYVATPIKIAVSMLLQQNTQEHIRLQKKTEHWLENYQENNVKSPVRDEESRFLIISEKTLLHKMLDEKNRKVQKTLDVSGKWQSTRRVLFDLSLDFFKEAIERGVRVRWITETHEEDKTTDKTLKTLKRPFFRIRYFSPPIPLQVAIYDEKEVSVCVGKALEDDVTSVWSNNPIFVKLVANYYEQIWKSAKKKPTQIKQPMFLDEKWS